MTVHTLGAPMIQINWQSSDRVDSASTTATATATFSPPPSVMPSPLPSEASATGSTKAGVITPGAIVGIAIGGLALVTATVGASWIWRRARHARLDSAQHKRRALEGQPKMVAIPAQPLDRRAARELQGSSPETGELSSVREPIELPGR